MAEIRVPKTPMKAFNKNRRPSELLVKQVEHLQWASLPASKRKPHQLKKLRPKTEAAAANEIARLTALVREQGATPYTPPAAAPPARSLTAARRRSRIPKKARRRIQRKK